MAGMTVWFLTLFMEICSVLGTSQAYLDGSKDCHHVVPASDEVVDGVYLEPHHHVKKRSIIQSLRIHVHYDESLDRLNDEYSDLVNSKVMQAIDFWSNTLQVRPTGVPIKLKKQCINTSVLYKDQVSYCRDGCAHQTVCGDITIPPEHLQGCHYWDDYRGFVVDHNEGDGIEGFDYILYVAAVHSDRCKNAKTIAYAAHCQQEASMDRPIAGYFSICPDSISLGKQDQKQLYATIKHEILHALGFTAGLYAFYHNEYGEPLTPRNRANNKPLYNSRLKLYQWSKNVIQQFTRTDWKLRTGVTNKTVNMIVLPKVQREVRRHFNCSTLEGGELEDQGIDGTSITHWEKRVFENEAMTGTYTQNSVISRITLALMEDTGWYRADYTKADDFEWGKNLGCDFVKKSCYDWITSRQRKSGDIHPYCDQVKSSQTVTDCTRNRNAVAICNLVQYTRPLPQKYQYFTELPSVAADDVPKFGGSVSLADYCPYLQEFTWKRAGIDNRGSHCGNPQNSLDPSINYLGEKYGRNSKCFNHKSKWTLNKCGNLIVPRHMGSACYTYECVSGAGLVVHVADRSFQCLHEGQIIQISFLSDDYLHQGDLICPSCDEVCKSFLINGSIVCPSQQTLCYQQQPPPPEESSSNTTKCSADGRTVIIDKFDDKSLVAPCACVKNSLSFLVALFNISIMLRYFLFF